MPGRRTGTTKAQNQMYEFETLAVLSESPNALTIADICNKSMTLNGLTPQKMARILSQLVNMGLVRKTQSKSKGRMVYIAQSQLEEQGVTLSDA
jgi:DNA-binding MarR family transcriptional regulator